jgi:hypothetical protein
MRSTTRMRLEDCAAVATGRVRFYAAKNDRSRVSVLGRIVDVAPHLTASFAVHEAINEPGWCVTDTECGGRAGFSVVSEADAIVAATANLATRTDADMHRARQRLQQLMGGGV